MAKQRKKASLAGDPRGDTGSPAFATAVLYSASHTPSTKSILHETFTKDTRHVRKQHTTAWQQWCYVCSRRHTWLIPLLIIIAITMSYLLQPGESSPVYSVIFLSYRRPPIDPNTSTLYGKGVKDFNFVIFYTVVLSFTREILMQRLIRPLGTYYGIRSRYKMARFMEQVYTAMYFSIFAPYGLFVMSRLPIWYFNTRAMFEGFPHREHEGPLKAYYLLQASYWMQQAIVLLLRLEKPRKDFKELVGHHIITLALIWLSYRFHFTYIGVAVYVTHDISDFFLASSRVLNYLDSSFTGLYYFTFVLIWIYMRHYLNIRILHAVLTEFATVGPFDLDWKAQQYKCWISQWITFVLLASLQALNLFWLFLILRILWNYIVTKVPTDETSDCDDDKPDENIDVADTRAI